MSHEEQSREEHEYRVVLPMYELKEKNMEKTIKELREVLNGNVEQYTRERIVSIQSSGVTDYRICKDTGIGGTSLTRFLRGGGMGSGSIDKLLIFINNVDNSIDCNESI